MRVFISQPMSGRSTKEILEDRDRAIRKIRKLFGNVEIIDSFIDSHFANPPLFNLGKAIQKMSMADVVYFAKGWESARGCKIERNCAIEYGIPIYLER